MNDGLRGRRVEDRASGQVQRAALLNELDHRVKNNLQLISSLVRIQARAARDPAVKAALGAVQERLVAMGVVHRRLFEQEDVRRFDLSGFLTDLAAELSAARPDGTAFPVSCDLEPIQATAEQAAPIALLVNELLTAERRRAAGYARRAEMTARCDSADLRIGIRVRGVEPWAGTEPDQDFGGAIADLLVRQLGACMTRDVDGTDVEVRLSVPLEIDRMADEHA